MVDVDRVFWRAITPADFFNIERSRDAQPHSGGGQSYITIAFAGLAVAELDEFLRVASGRSVGGDRPVVTLEAVSTLDTPVDAAPLVFRSRYRPPNPDGRYRIATQNRQFQERHPAWSPSRGFPVAPDDVASASDLRIPDLSYLKVFVARLDDGTYRAGYSNTHSAPPQLSGLLAPLFLPYDETASAGVIRLASGALPVETLAVHYALLTGRDETHRAPEIEAIEALTATQAGKRSRGQGWIQSTEVKIAVEQRAMVLASEHLVAAGWSVADVSGNHSFDLQCTKNGSELRVEVKGTTGDGSVVLLTPNEVLHARSHGGALALIIVSGIEVTPGTPPTATGGELRILDPWILDDQGDLRATGWRYVLS